MKTLLCLTFVVAITICATFEPVLGCRPMLVQELEKRGISDRNTSKIVIVGTEADYGNIQVVVTEDFIIQSIWDTIYQSRPYSSWAASGFRRVQFYIDKKSETPQAELKVNMTDRCHFSDDFDNAFRCPGLNNILLQWLKVEYEKRKSR